MKRSTDLRAVARAATFGAADLLLADIDAVKPGTVDETDGAVALAAKPGAASYGVIDEITRRALLEGGKVLAVDGRTCPTARKWRSCA